MSNTLVLFESGKRVAFLPVAHSPHYQNSLYNAGEEINVQQVEMDKKTFILT